LARTLHQESPLVVALKGAGAGLLGTLVLTLAMDAAARLRQPEQSDGAAPDRTVESAGSSEPPTERLVEKVASGVFEAELSPDARQTLGMGIHWGYGALWGAAYGLVRTSVPLPGWLQAALLGLTVWLVGPMGLVPAMKLADRPTDRSPSRSVVPIALHQLFGWVTAAAFHVLSQDA
jgi:putative membrane protein